MTEYIVNPEEEYLFYGDNYESIVRCKNCQYWDIENKQEITNNMWSSICKYFSEYNEDNINEIYTNECGFCRWGKMRENDNRRNCE